MAVNSREITSLGACHVFIRELIAHTSRHAPTYKHIQCIWALFPLLSVLLTFSIHYHHINTHTQTHVMYTHAVCDDFLHATSGLGYSLWILSKLALLEKVHWENGKMSRSLKVRLDTHNHIIYLKTLCVLSLYIAVMVKSAHFYHRQNSYNYISMF